MNQVTSSRLDNCAFSLLVFTLLRSPGLHQSCFCEDPPHRNVEFLEVHIGFLEMLLIKGSHLFFPPSIGSSFKKKKPPSDLRFVLPVIATVLSFQLLTMLCRNHI